jgi:hypothetical protein
MVPNPLHTLQLSQGMWVICDALADWAILSVDPSGRLLPSWRLRQVYDDQIHIHHFARQDKYQQFQCYKNTVKWCGFLWGLAHTHDTMFQEDAVRRAEQALEQSYHIKAVHAYPYDKARAWRKPYVEEALSVLGWITERMINQEEQQAEHFVESLLIDWLSAYSLDELPPNPNASSLGVDHRRGYVLYTMSLSFEHGVVKTPEECEKL